MAVPLQTSGFGVRALPQLPSMSPSEFVVDTALAARMGLEGRRQRLAEASEQRNLDMMLQERRAAEAREALAAARLQGQIAREERQLSLQEREAEDIARDRAIGRRLQEENITSLQESRRANMVPKVETDLVTLYNPETDRNEIVVVNRATGEPVRTVGPAPTSDTSRAIQDRMLLDDARNLAVDIRPFTELAEGPGGATMRIVDPQGLNSAVAAARAAQAERNYALEVMRAQRNRDPLSGFREQYGIAPEQESGEPPPVTLIPQSRVQQRAPAPAPARTAAPAPQGPVPIGTMQAPFPDRATFDRVLEALPPGTYYVRDAGRLTEIEVGDQ